MWEFLKGKNKEEGGKKKYIFFFVKKSTDFNFFGKIEWSMDSEPRRAGGSQEYLKKLFTFSNPTKNSN